MLKWCVRWYFNWILIWPVSYLCAKAPSKVTIFLSLIEPSAGTLVCMFVFPIPSTIACYLSSLSVRESVPNQHLLTQYLYKQCHHYYQKRKLTNWF